MKAVNSSSKTFVLSERLLENLGKVIFGKQVVLRQLVVGLLSEGHVLIEDVPGVGKTMLARALAVSTGCQFSRIQFTPDLLPGDITGVSVFDLKRNIFDFRAGPVFTHILLADEINRASPKTQSALLEAMGEFQVTIDNVTRELPKPFFVIATQNPIEHEGVFPLPESQMDRFLMRVSLGYPPRDVEVKILEQMQVIHPIDKLTSISTSEQILEAQREIRETFVSEPVREYIIKIIDATRHHPDILIGASPRAGLGILRAAQSEAVLNQRDFVTPDDVFAISESVLSHRLVLSPEARMSRVTQNGIIREILGSIRAPIAQE